MTPTLDRINARHCHVCHASEIHTVGQKPGHRTAQAFTYQRCAHCAFMWVTPFPGYDIYDDAYYAGQGPDPYVDYAREYADSLHGLRTLEFENLWQHASNHLASRAPSQEPARMLDYGCGAGGFMSYALARAATTLKAPLQIHGFDIGSYATRLRTEKNYTILRPDELAAGEARYDVVVCIEVLEHCLDIDEPIRTISRLLKPGGLLILTTGNLRSPAARMAGLDYRYLIPDIHISLFNPHSLALLYQKHGLSPRRLRHDGLIRYKVLKSLQTPQRQRWASALLRIPGVVRLLDLFYGVSAMPCAMKP